MRIGVRRLMAMSRPSIRFTRTTRSAIIRSQVSEFWRKNLQALRSHHPGKPSGFNVRRMIGRDDLWVTEYTITYQGKPAFTVSIMEFRDGKVVHETQYFADPFEAPAWRKQWVEQKA